MSNEIPADLILFLNEEVKRKKAHGINVKNGTIGMMYLDDGKLPVPSVIRDVLATHNKDCDLCYSSVSGTEEYNSSLINWFFDGMLNKEFEERKLQSLATIGGTGACTISFYDCAANKDSVLLFPKLSWPNYISIADMYNIEFDTYNNFDESQLDINDIKSKIAHYSSLNKDITLLINDPCQNPTGFTMDKKDWERLTSLICKYNKQQRISVIYDCAYIDFCSHEQKKLISDSLLFLSKYVDIYLCMSFSKTFSFYGLRVGALGILSNSVSRTNSLYNKAIDSARTVWSVPNHVAINTISHLLTDKKYVGILKQEVSNVSSILKIRTDIFINEANECSLKLHPYSFGFYVSLSCEDSIKTAKILQDKNIYVVPLDDKNIRVAISCLSTEQISGLAKQIKLAL